VHAPTPARHLRRAAALGAAWASLVGVVGCANVIVDGAGPGGTPGEGGGATTTEGAGASPVECSGTYGQVSDAIVTAQTCDPASQTVQCSGSAMVRDLCGCPVIANETDAQAIATANAAYAMCASMGCCGPAAHPVSPPPCTTTCPPVPTGGHCDPSTSLCAPGP